MPFPPSQLDSTQILQGAYDETTQTLRTTATATIIGGDLQVEIDQETDSISIGDGTTLFTGTQNGPKNGLDVNIINENGFEVTQGTSPWIIDGTIALPPDAATETTLSSLNNKVPSDLTVSSNRLLVDSSGVIQPVSQSGTWTVYPGDMANTEPWLMSISQDGNTASVSVDGSLKVDNSGIIQPVSGTVSVSNFPAIQSVSQSGTWDITNVSGTVSLPTGASTSALQTTGNTSLNSIDSKVPANLTVTSTRLLVDGSGVTQPVSGSITATQAGVWSVNRTWTLGSGTDSIAVSPLTNSSIVKVQLQDNSGAAITVGQKTMTSSVPVVISSDQSTLTVGLPSGASTSANQVTANSSLSNIDGKTPSLGQAVMASSSPVVIASNQTAVPISGTVTSNQGTSPWVNNISQFGGSNVVTGTGTSGSGVPRVTVSNDSNILATQSGTWNITNISGTVSLPTGASTAANQATGNASLSSIDAGIPAALGQTTMANSMPVVLASDQSNINVLTRSLVSNYNSNGASFSIISDVLNAQATESNLIYINNSISNTKTIYITDILCATDPGSNNWTKFRMYYNPTVTVNGTVKAIVSNKAGSATASVMSAFTIPTTTLRGTLIDMAIGAGSTQGYGFNISESIECYYIIPPGNSLLISGEAKANNTPTVITIDWFEV